MSSESLENTSGVSQWFPSLEKLPCLTVVSLPSGAALGHCTTQKT